MELRTNNFEIGETPKNSGSFTSSFGLASFLVPAGVFALVVAFLVLARRPLSVVVFLLSMVAVIASYVRTALVAVVAGTLVLAAVMVAGAGVPRRRRAIRRRADRAGARRRVRRHAGGRHGRRTRRAARGEPPQPARGRVGSDPLRHLGGIAREGGRRARSARAWERSVARL